MKSLIEWENARDKKKERLEQTYEDQFNSLKIKFEGLVDKVEAYHLQLSSKADKLSGDSDTRKCDSETLDGVTSVTRAEWRQQKMKNGRSLRANVQH